MPFSPVLAGARHDDRIFFRDYPDPPYAHLDSNQEPDD
jgi:hypothetical protein